MAVPGGDDKSLARPTSWCRRTESIVSLERGFCSCAELQVFSCYRVWKEACQATRAISTTSRRELSSSILFRHILFSLYSLRGSLSAFCFILRFTFRLRCFYFWRRKFPHKSYFCLTLLFLPFVCVRPRKWVGSPLGCKTDTVIQWICCPEREKSFLGLQVRIPQGAWDSVLRVVCVVG